MAKPLALVTWSLTAAMTVLLSALLPSSGLAAGKTGRVKAAETLLPTDYIAGAWWLYKSAFVENGRVIDRSNGNVSHSEGQGYGMLIAVAADDREAFDTLWAWTRENLQVRGDALSAWRWSPDTAIPVADMNNASDGDLLIAWALSRAATRWREPALAVEARRILKDLTAKATVTDATYGTLLLPAAQGFGGSAEQPGIVVNLSYWVFPAIEELGLIDPSFPAADLVASGKALLERGRFGSSHLPADWLSLTGDHPQPAPAFAATFGYEAVRVPLYTAWFGGAPLSLLTGVQQRWNENGANVMHVMDLATATTMTAMPDPGYRAVSALLSCGLGRAGQASSMPPFEPTEYYPSTLHLLSIIAISERYASCLPSQN
ncbi:endoglucanase [Rhizobium sp. PP-CC-3A-592]|nr:endoglucanase [Rhizobium sp. PP-CC-3A-592]